MIATSNFINVVGAITSSLLFFGVVTVAQKAGMTPEMKDRQTLGTGTLDELLLHRGRPVYFAVEVDGGTIRNSPRPDTSTWKRLTFDEVVHDITSTGNKEDIIEVANTVKEKMRVSVTRFELHGINHYEIVPEGTQPTPDYDFKTLPTYLFLGAAGMTLLIAILLARPLLQVQKEQSAA
jgi:hypothetical protein